MDLLRDALPGGRLRGASGYHVLKILGPLCVFGEEHFRGPTALIVLSCEDCEVVVRWGL